LLGTCEGDTVGVSVGSTDGEALGTVEGEIEGLNVGNIEGLKDGESKDSRQVIKKGQTLTADATTGRVFAGSLELVNLRNK
jgi:hypothetical protein